MIFNIQKCKNYNTTLKRIIILKVIIVLIKLLDSQDKYLIKQLHN